MEINPTIFRTYDIRGRYPKELSEGVARKIAQAFVELYPHAKRLVVAYDTRPSSPSLAQALTGVLQEQGKEVISLGVAPDPLFYFSMFHYGYEGGMMVSGSHNLGSFNGITLSVKRSGKDIVQDVVEDELELLKKKVMQDQKPSPQAETPGSIVQLDPAQDYIQYVSQLVHLRRLLTIVFDSGNGAMGFLPEQVFEKLGCKTRTLYGEFDGRFPNHPADPYQEKNLKDIMRAVVQEKADLGFAYDGDGDRVALIDNKGRVVGGDFCLSMLAHEAISKKKGPIVHDMRVSKAFLDAMEKEGVQTYFSVSHHNAIIDKVLKTGAVFGGEVTLHFVLPLDYYLCDDALFASLKLAEVASSHADLAAFVDSLPRYHASPELFVDTPDEEKFHIIGALQEYLKEHGYDFIDVDGARINFPKGWALARAANTSPYIKCRFEGETEKDLVAIEKEALQIFKKVGIPIENKHYQELGLPIEGA